MSGSAAALVLTYRRPRLAGQTVRWLLDGEGMAPSDIVLVVNGDGGLEDPELEGRIEVVRLPENLGPAGGFAQGLRHIHRTRTTSWVYACEDDVALYDLPAPRIDRLIEEVNAFESRSGDRVGAVVAYGRDVDIRTGRTTPHLAGDLAALEDIGMGQWGATLLSRRVLDEGVFPYEPMFWGYEDLDFFLTMQHHGFRLLVDTQTARSVHAAVTRPARTTWGKRRPNRRQEPWTGYYAARNYFMLARRHGDWRWTAGHLASSARRLQHASSNRERTAIVRGVIDGMLGREGKNPSFVREVGEL